MQLCVYNQTIFQLHLQLSQLETQLLEEQQINKRLTSDGAPKLHEGKNAQTDITLEVEKLHEVQNSFCSIETLQLHLDNIFVGNESNVSTVIGRTNNQ